MIGSVIFCVIEWSLVAEICSSIVIDGRRFLLALASMVLPEPGGPDSKILCLPAMAIMRALLAFSWPEI